MGTRQEVGVGVDDSTGQDQQGAAGLQVADRLAHAAQAVARFAGDLDEMGGHVGQLVQHRHRADDDLQVIPVQGSGYQRHFQGAGMIGGHQERPARGNGVGAANLHLSHEELTRQCELAIRTYDPCISCATHFLDLEVEHL